MHRLLILVFLVARVAAGPTLNLNSQSQDQDCLENDNRMYSCFLVKTLVALNKADRSNDIKIIEGITFMRETPMERTAKNLQSEQALLNKLPQEDSTRMATLLSMLYDSAISFMKSHSLKFNMAEISIPQILAEGRAKAKKTWLPLITAIGIKFFAVMPFLLGSLSLLTMKALFIGKIALLIVGIIAFQKLFSGGGGGGGYFPNNAQFAGWDNNAAWSNAAANNQIPYNKRSLQDEAVTRADAQYLAYSAYVPSTVSYNN
ncbi:uncharacterized protein LOC105192071 [Harpegnathos saltator]|uniref:uncharacterized protein LOC105192071 n=1 Tax=Harpegnathos saltator TaxID=610380 RepID=UPI00058E2129|nr:uncharacterized protein LOC105192071 [Harpegnathos saltator]